MFRRVVAFTDQQQSETLGSKLEGLAATLINDDRPDKETKVWLEGLPDELRVKLLAWGMLDGKTATLAKPLTEHVDDYHASLLDLDRSEDHANLVKSRVLKILAGCGFTYWKDLDRGKVESWLKRERDGGMKQQTNRHYVRNLKAFCRWVVDEGRAAESPVATLTPVPVIDETVPGVFTVEQIQTLLTTTYTGRRRGRATGRDRAMLYKVAVETALRANELRTLTRSSFKLDADPPTVTIEARNSRKSNKRKMIPLRPELVGELRDYLANKVPAARVLIVPTQTAKMLRADLVVAGVPTVDADGNKLVFHSLRHSAATWLDENGVPLKVVQAILGHSTFKLTSDRYTHTRTKRVAEAIANMPTLRLRATGTDGDDGACAQHARQAAAHCRDLPDSALVSAAPTLTTALATPRMGVDSRTGGRAAEGTGLLNRRTS